MKVLLLVHHKLIPPRKAQTRAKIVKAPWRTEYDVHAALKRLGHQVDILGLENSLEPLVEKIEKQKPDVVFNLLEEFAGQALFDQNLVNYLELLGVPYTGCNGRGLLLARDKAIAKKIASFEGVQTPKFIVVARRQKKVTLPNDFCFPLIVKCLTEEASLGLSNSSVVNSNKELKTQIVKMQTQWAEDLLIEEYIAGRELYVGVIGNESLQVLPTRELHFGCIPRRAPKIASAKVKWSLSYRKRYGIYTRQLKKTSGIFHQQLQQSAERIYRALRLSGYARIDFRVDEQGQIYFIEANPNPQICQYEDFADAAMAAGISFDQLIQKVLDLGHRASVHLPARL